MENLLRNTLLRLFPPVLMLFASAVLASCSDDADDGPAEARPVTMQFEITTRADDSGSDAPEDSTGTGQGTDNEFIHSLWVFVVDPTSGNVVWRYNGVIDSDGADARMFLSDTLTIPSGVYDVYAFANFDYYTTAESESAIKTLLETDVNGTINKACLDNIIIDNPAGHICFDGGSYIPMSGRHTGVAVTPATAIIPVTLDRLVSKVNITMRGDVACKVTSLKFCGWADKVPLFPGNSSIQDLNCCEDTAFTSFTCSENNYTIPPFYVNETPDGHPFYITLKTGEAGSPEYYSKTTLDCLQRNSIYPLILQLDKVCLTIEAQCWVSPIGAYPVEVEVGLTENTYNISIPEGSQFQFTLSLQGNDITNQQCTWQIDEKNIDGIAFESHSESSSVVKGHVTASAGQTFSLGVNASWTADGTAYHRKYTVNLTTADISDFEFKAAGNNPSGVSARGGSGFTPGRLQPEVLIMSRK